MGTYRLDEEIASTQLKTGQSIAYTFNISGEGNISAIERPAIPADGPFDFYEPNVQQSVNRQNGKVVGTKSFRYFIVPKEPGQYNLGDYFAFVFFNPAKKKYDTLKSKVQLTVEGESHRNQAIRSSDLGSFYDRIDGSDNTLHNSSELEWVKTAANALIGVLLIVSIYLMVRRRVA